jgi:hypothetical protein
MRNRYRLVALDSLLFDGHLGKTENNVVALLVALT